MHKAEIQVLVLQADKLWGSKVQKCTFYKFWVTKKIGVLYKSPKSTFCVLAFIKKTDTLSPRFS